MKCLRRILGIGVAVFLLFWLVIHPARPNEPSYRGRTLTDWLQTDENGKRLGPTSQHYYLIVTNSMVAIQAIGTNGIPTLLKLIQAHDSKPKIVLLSWLAHQRWLHTRVLPDWEKHNMGIRGLRILGTNAASAVPALIQLTHDGNGDVRFDAGYGLFVLLEECFRHDRDVCLPILLSLSNDSDSGMQFSAANTMAIWFPEEAEKAGV